MGERQRHLQFFCDHFFQFWMVQQARINQRLVVVFVGSCSFWYVSRAANLVVSLRIFGSIHLKLSGHDTLLSVVRNMFQMG